MVGGRVRCWGDNSAAGQLGTGSPSAPGISTTPVEVNGITDAIAIVAGNGHTCVLTTSGRVWCWGWNYYGQLGFPGGDAHSPTQISAAQLSGVRAITSGEAHTCAVKENGTALCWGFNDGGQVGDGTRTGRNTPVAVQGLAGSVEAMGAGAYHTCARLNTGAIQCWGNNTYGQLGNGTNTNSLVPVTVVGSPPPGGSSGSSRLNDTGITWSGSATSGNATTCSGSHPAGQDCRYGRDAKAAAGSLTKIGASTTNNGVVNGFDYTKISNVGNVLPASAALGTGDNDWACTRDNVTGLIWEVKTTSGLRSQDHHYTWYDSNSPDGNPGTANYYGSCYPYGALCHTEKFVQDVNAQGLCGHNDWRMPTIQELGSIVDLGRSYSDFAGNTAIDPGYFPNTPSSFFWSGSPSASDTNNAWGVYLIYGGHNGFGRRDGSGRVRLVRAGQ